MKSISRISDHGIIWERIDDERQQTSVEILDGRVSLLYQWVAEIEQRVPGTTFVDYIRPTMAGERDWNETRQTLLRRLAEIRAVAPVDEVDAARLCFALSRDLGSQHPDDENRAMAFSYIRDAITYTPFHDAVDNITHLAAAIDEATRSAVDSEVLDRLQAHLEDGGFQLFPVP